MPGSKPAVGGKRCGIPAAPYNDYTPLCVCPLFLLVFFSKNTLTGCLIVRASRHNGRGWLPLFLDVADVMLVSRADAHRLPPTAGLVSICIISGVALLMGEDEFSRALGRVFFTNWR